MLKAVRRMACRTRIADYLGICCDRCLSQPRGHTTSRPETMPLGPESAIVEG